MHRRALIASTLALLTIGAMPAAVPASEVAWLQVYLDRFELEGSTYTRRSDLVASLRLVGKMRKVSLKWVIPKTEAERTQMTKKVEEAQSAADEAGLGRLPAVANEVF